MNAIHKWDISITHSKAQGTSWKIRRKSMGAEGRKGQEGDQCGTVSAQDTAIVVLNAQQLHKIYTRSVPSAPIMKGREVHGVHPF